MIKNRKMLEEFEKQLAKREKVDIKRNFQIIDKMVQYARSLGLWPPEDPLEGIEKDIKLAEVLREYGRAHKENSTGAR